MAENTAKASQEPKSLKGWGLRSWKGLTLPSPVQTSTLYSIWMAVPMEMGVEREPLIVNCFLCNQVQNKNREPLALGKWRRQHPNHESGHPARWGGGCLCSSQATQGWPWSQEATLWDGLLLFTWGWVLVSQMYCYWVHDTGLAHEFQRHLVKTWRWSIYREQVAERGWICTKWMFHFKFVAFPPLPLRCLSSRR